MFTSVTKADAVSVLLFKSSNHFICLFIVDPNKAGRIVRRPTERDIFWDETTGQYLDPSCLLDPKSLPPFCKERQNNHPNSVIPCGREERIQRVQPQGETEQTGHWGRSTERDSSWTAERKEECKEDSGTTQLSARDVQSGGSGLKTLS